MSKFQRLGKNNGFAVQPGMNQRLILSTGEDPYPSSPFYDENMRDDAKILKDLTTNNGEMGWVKDRRGNSHRVRVDCQHYAPYISAKDCRFNCGKTAKESASYNSEAINQ